MFECLFHETASCSRTATGQTDAALSRNDRKQKRRNIKRICTEVKVLDYIKTQVFSET